MTPSAEHLIKHGLSTTYWGKKIIAAEARGKFTNNNQDRAGEWTTCACGKSTSDIPTTKMGYLNEPIDDHLRQLGMDFYSDVEGDRFLSAAKTLVEIETRAHIVASEYLV